MKKAAILGGLIWSTTAACHAAGVPITTDQYNTPGGPARLTQDGSLNQPLVGKADNATVGGSALVNILSALTAQNRISSAIPKSWIGIAGGVAALDKDALMSSAVSGDISQAHMGNMLFTDYVKANYLTSASINQPNGVVGLDSSGKFTGAINTQTLQTTSSYTAPDSTVVTIPQIDLSGQLAQALSPSTVGPETSTIGGLANSDGVVGNRSLSILGRPYGNYNAGFTLGIFSTASSLAGAGGQAAISPYAPSTGAAAVAKGDLSVSDVYQYDELSDARVVASATAFTATTVTLASNMTAAQMAALHQNMYVATNVIDPTLPVTDNSTHPTETAYWGYLQSWTANTLTVYGWAVPGSGNTTAGQVPDVTHLDATKATYTTPMVFVGVPTKIVSKTTQVAMDGSKVYGSSATARANEYNWQKVNFAPTNFSAANSYRFQGVTMNVACSTCNSAAASSDSYGYYINAPNLPHAYVANVSGTGTEFSGSNTYIPGNGYPTAQNDSHLLSDFASSLPTNNTLHLATSVVKSMVDSSGWGDWEIRLGMNIDGTRANGTLQGGTNMASIAFNHNNQTGALSLLTGWGTEGLRLNNDSSVTVVGKSEFSTDAVFDASITAATNVSAANLRLAGGTLDKYSLDGVAKTAGSILGWGALATGNNQTEFVNMDANGSGGYSFYEGAVGSSLRSATRLMSMTPSRIDAYTPFYSNSDLVIAAGHKLYFPTGTSTSSSTTLSALANGNLTVATQVSGGGGIQDLTTVNTSRLQIGLASDLTQDTILPMDFKVASRQGKKFGGGLIEYTDRYHAENPLGTFGALDTNGNPTITSDNSHSWITWGATNATDGFNFEYSDGVSVYSMLKIAPAGITSTIPLSGPSAQFDTISSRTNAAMVVGSPLSMYALSQSNLPSAPSAGESVYCSDCTSGLLQGGYTKKGLMITWNGSDWTDGTGNKLASGGYAPVGATEGFSAAGSTIADASLIGAKVVVIAAATSGQGVKPDGRVQIGDTVKILNRTYQDVLIYPDSTNSAIESNTAGVPITVSAQSAVELIHTSSTEWRVE